MRFLSFLVLLLGSWVSLGAQSVLKFGVIPTESSVNLRADYEPLRAALEKRLGLKVEMFFAPDYTSVIEAMRFNQVHLAWFGNNSAIDAVDRAQGEVFAQTVDKDGNAGYWSQIVVHRDSPLSSLDDLIARRAELTLSMGDAQSTSGTLVPGYYAFALNKVNPAREFKAVRAANHEANMMAVAMKQIDAATTNNESFFRLEQAKPEMTARLKVIWTGPLIASDPLLYRKDLPAELRAKIAEFFHAYGATPEERATIAPLKWSGFKPATNDQLLPYRLLRVMRERVTIENDDKLAPAEKAARLAALSTQQEALEERVTASKEVPLSP
jgi:phosphonate transport system substrate-binding protein